jgi:hypothetical protein
MNSMIADAVKIARRKHQKPSIVRFGGESLAT